MPTSYTVKQGDHISSIAKNAGLPWTKIWNDPNNADLKALRVNPNVLFPGDQVYVPDMVPSEYPKPTDQTHKFSIDTQTLKLCLTLEDIYEKPIAQAPCMLQLGGDTITVTTDAAGKLQQTISADLRNAFLTINSPNTAFQGEKIAIMIGDLDPVDQVSGQQARLNNLGYFAGPVGGTDDDALESAIEEFQCDQGLTVDGVCGPQTQAALKTAHGC